MKKEEQEATMHANSMQVLEDFNAGDNSFEKVFSVETSLQLIRNDPIVSAAIETKVDKAMEGGWGLRVGDKARQETQMSIFKRDYRFDKFLRTALRTVQWQDLLIEIVKKGDKVTDLNILNTAEIDVETDPNGDPISYTQESPNDGQDPIVWKAEQVVHIKFKDALLNFWGESDLRVAFDTLVIKDNVRKYLTWLFGTNQFRTHFSFKTLNDNMLRRFVSSYKQGENTYGKPVITEGEIMAGPLRKVEELDQMIALLDWCDTQLISLFQTTTVNMGIGGSGGRSEGDSLGDVQRTSILALQRVVEEGINFDLFPKMGLSRKDEFFWKPLDRMSKKQLFEVIEIMKRSTFTDEAVQEFMMESGMEFKTKNLFKAPEEVEGPTPEQRSAKDGSASRQRKSEGEADTNIGTGQESSTREEQLVAQSDRFFINDGEESNE